MPISHHLEEFSAGASPASSTQIISAEALEDHRLNAFEQGYSSGWDDAMTAQAENKARISAALASSLEDMSFTYHEVQTQVLACVEPIFESLVAAVLPATMMRVFGYRIVDELCALTKEQIAQPVVIAVSSGDSAGLKAIVARGFALPVELQEDPSLEPGMAIIRVGSHEHELDSNQLLASLNQAVTSFFHQITKDSAHG